METETIQLTNEEIARIFAMYMPKKIIHSGGSAWSYPQFRILFGWSSIDVDDLVFDIDECHFEATPLNKISDEDAIEIWKIANHYPSNEPEIEWAKKSVFVEVINKNWHKIRNDIYQYLVQKGYAVALFFGINHPLNGKTAIELGIAIDKTTLK